jgi:hypothetical protein
MNMEIARLTNVSWLQIPDWRLLALRALSPRVAPRVQSRGDQPRTSSDPMPQRLPVLDWPPDLFDDEAL